MSRHAGKEKRMPAGHEGKKKAARKGKRQVRWASVIAMMLSLVFAGASFGCSPQPTQPSGTGVPSPAEETGGDRALAIAQYPDMPDYPDENAIDSPDGYEAYEQAYDEWQNAVQALETDRDYAPMMRSFVERSMNEFACGSDTENHLYSPLNVYMALSMLAETAGGDSRQQILDVLDAPSIEELRRDVKDIWKSAYRDDGIMRCLLANSIWLSDSMTEKPPQAPGFIHGVRSARKCVDYTSDRCIIRI